MGDLISLRARRPPRARTIELTPRAAEALDNILAHYMCSGHAATVERLGEGLAVKVVEDLLVMSYEYGFQRPRRGE